MTPNPEAARGGTRAGRLIRAAGVGLVVGVTFLTFAAYRIEQKHAGNPSGLVHISDWRFDRNPLINERLDLRHRLALESSDGFDGQYFYFMTFDPLLTTYRHRPRSYTRVLDSPAYRFGRIGFSWLTRAFSGGREVRYPVTMVALVLVSLGMCGALLGLFAMRHGMSAWYGAVVLAIPGLWQVTVLTVPEPITLAFVLAGLLLAGSQRWVLAGLCLGIAMLVRETSGAIVLAIPASLFLAGRRREAATVLSLAFVPVAVWKIYVGWVFFPVEGLRAFFPHPDDVGLPFMGVWRFWMEVVEGTSPQPVVEQWSGMLFSILLLSAAVLVAVAFVKRRSALAAAAVFSALLVVSFNYELVWSLVAGAQRLSIDLFLTLALVFLQQGRERPVPRVFVAFWIAAAAYVLFGMAESPEIRSGLVGWIG